MAPRDGGVDLACVWDGQVHTMRMRYCLDAERRVRLLGTGVLYGTLTRAEVRRGRVSVTPARYKKLVAKCVDNARPLLRDALREYLRRFPPATRPLVNIANVL